MFRDKLECTKAYQPTDGGDRLATITHSSPDPIGYLMDNHHAQPKLLALHPGTPDIPTGPGTPSLHAVLSFVCHASMVTMRFRSLPWYV